MASTHADHGTTSAPVATGPDRSIGEVVKLVVSAVVLVVLVVFAVANADDVRFDYLAGDADVPLIVVMLGSAVAGAVVAALLRHRRS